MASPITNDWVSNSEVWIGGGAIVSFSCKKLNEFIEGFVAATTHGHSDILKGLVDHELFSELTEAELDEGFQLLADGNFLRCVDILVGSSRYKELKSGIAVAVPLAADRGNHELVERIVNAPNFLEMSREDPVWAKAISDQICILGATSGYFKVVAAVMPRIEAITYCFSHVLEPIDSSAIEIDNPTEVGAAFRAVTKHGTLSELEQVLRWPGFNKLSVEELGNGFKEAAEGAERESDKSSFEYLKVVSKIAECARFSEIPKADCNEVYEKLKGINIGFLSKARAILSLQDPWELQRDILKINLETTLSPKENT